MISFLQFSPFGGCIFYGKTGRNSLVDDCRSSRAHINAANIAQFPHTGYPVTGKAARFTLLCQRFGDGRIGIFRQTDTFYCALFHGFSQLFCPHNHLIFVDFRQNPTLGDFTIFFSVHTDTYYTHIFRKVNKIYWFFSTFPISKPAKTNVFAARITVHPV